MNRSKTLGNSEMSGLIKDLKGKNRLDSLDLAERSPTVKFMKQNSGIREKPVTKLDEKHEFDPACLITFDDDEEKMSKWTFDCTKIQSELEKSRLIWFMLASTGYMQKNPIDTKQLCSFITDIRKGYDGKRKNPFHNFEHGITGLALPLKLGLIFL